MTLIDAYDDRHNGVIRWDNGAVDVALDIVLVEGAVVEGQGMLHAEGGEEAGADGVLGD